MTLAVISFIHSFILPINGATTVCQTLGLIPGTQLCAETHMFLDLTEPIL